MTERTAEVEAAAIRLATIALVLLAGEKLSARDIARRWSVSLRTAQRDINRVERIIPVVVTQKRDFGAPFVAAACSPIFAGIEVIRR